MPFDSFGISLKPSYAVLFPYDSSRTTSATKKEPLKYEEMHEFYQKSVSKEEHDKSQRERKTVKQPKSNVQETLSRKSQSRIKNYINLLVECSDEKEIYSRKENLRFIYRVGFCTLTLPSDFNMYDADVYRLVFKPFIRILKEQFDLGEYLWKAEVQDNGQLHFHLTLNVWIHWFYINREWNNQLKKNGYTFASVNHERATTEIHSTKSVKNLAAYLCGYVTKKDTYKKKGKEFIKANYNKKTTQTDLPESFFLVGGEYRKRNINIKLWDCSVNLKKGKLTLRNPQVTHPRLYKDIIRITTEEIQKDFFSIWIFPPEKRKLYYFFDMFWNSYILETKQVGKQSPLTIIETIYEPSN